MLKILNSLNHLNRVGLPMTLAPLTLGLAILTATVPAKALPLQGGVYINVGQPQPVYPNTIIYGNSPGTVIYSNPFPNSYGYGSSTTNYIYGSPIPNPVPLNQGTGLYNSQSPGYYYNVNPIVPLPGQAVTPGVYDSVLVNPVIVNPPAYPTNSVYGYPGYYQSYPRHNRVFIRR